MVTQISFAEAEELSLGKLLVVDFRSVFEESTAEALKPLQNLHQRFGKHPRFALLTMAIARDIEGVESYPSDNKFAWQCANAGMVRDKI